MRLLMSVAVCAVLAGCAASRQEVAQRLGSQYIGRSADELVREFGPPASSFKMQSGKTAYSWQLASVTDVSGDSGYAQASTRSCKVSVIADPKGIVTQLDTEDSNAGRGIVTRAFGLAGSICAQRLGMKPQS